MNCLLLARVTGSEHTCGFEVVISPKGLTRLCSQLADWRLVYQKHVYYVCDRHLDAGEKSVHAQHDTQLKGAPDGKN